MGILLGLSVFCVIWLLCAVEEIHKNVDLLEKRIEELEEEEGQ